VVLPASILYLDSSALVKLILPEAETIPLLRLLLSWPYRIASEIAFVEVHRAVRRTSADDVTLRRAEEVLTTIHFMEIHSGVLCEASLLQPRTLRSLDAIHLASALNLRPGLGAMVTYDGGMTEAARRLHLKVLAPS
jgi:predicted nucleic acid-binding protein